MFKKIYNRFINSGKHSRTRCSLAALTSALFIAFRMFPTVSVKALASILPNFLYKAPKHTTAALKQHLHRKQSHDQKGWWYRHLNTMKNVTIQTFPILGGSAFYGGVSSNDKIFKIMWVCVRLFLGLCMWTQSTQEAEGDVRFALELELQARVSCLTMGARNPSKVFWKSSSHSSPLSHLSASLECF